MQPLEKALETAKLEGPWKQELYRFLLQYWTTSYCTKEVPPAELLFNRIVWGKIPEIPRKKVINQHQEARENEKKRKEHNKHYAVYGRNVQKSKMRVGDYVLDRQESKNKLTTNFNPDWTKLFRRKM